MALQVWLHGKDLINRGLCPNNASWVGSATYVDGKLGKCYSCTSSHYIDYTYNFASTNKFTIAFWIYIPASLSTCNKWECVFSLPEYPISWASYNNLKIYDISNNQLWWLDGSMFYDKWVHLTIAHNADTITLYINGDHYNTANSVSSPISSGTMHVGNGITDAHGPVKFNDIRLYDHCLSPKEVKEISKGLVLHYPLNDAYVEGTTNIASNLSPSQIGGWQKMTITKLSTNNYHLKHQTSDSANLSYWSTFVYTLPSEYSNKTISFSARIKNIVYNNIKDSSWLYIGPGNNGQYPTHGRATFYCYELKENQLISWTGVLSNSNRYVLVELWNDANSTSGSIEFDLVDIQIEEKDHVTPYTPNTRNETTVHDCSGYQNNGTISGSLSCSSDSPRYKTCIETNASQIIDAPIGNGIPSSDLTVACWVKRPKTIDSNTMRCWLLLPFGNNQRFYFRILPQGNTAIFNIGFGANTYGNKTVDATWHHLAATTSSDGKTISVYVDGVLTNTGTEANAFNLAGNLKLVSNFIGKMSDFRFYRTALSADDIKELYNTSCIINS